MHWQIHVGVVYGYLRTKEQGGRLEVRAQVLGSAQRPIPTIGAAGNGTEQPIPTSETEQDENVRSSVSETTAVATSLRADLGSRVMARVQELEDDLSKFCADPSNRITVTCRNYFFGKSF
ncbi:hypothetical protein MRX96_020687 [Rhipicephalus microplus]